MVIGGAHDDGYGSFSHFSHAKDSEIWPLYRCGVLICPASSSINCPSVLVRNHRNPAFWGRVGCISLAAASDIRATLLILDAGNSCCC